MPGLARTVRLRLLMIVIALVATLAAWLATLDRIAAHSDQQPLVDFLSNYDSGIAVAEA